MFKKKRKREHHTNLSQKKIKMEEIFGQKAIVTLANNKLDGFPTTVNER